MDDKEKKFCEELTALLLKYRFGIADEPYIYDLSDDYMESTRSAHIDEEGRLHFV